MEVSIYNKYKEIYLSRISKMFEVIDNLEEDIQNIDINANFEFDFNKNSTFDPKKLAIRELKSEIVKYIQYNNGSLSFDIVLIKYMLKQLLVYTYILKEQKLSKEEINTCKFEIGVRIYFLLNCIYNFREKIKRFFTIEIKKGFRIRDDNILKEKEEISGLLKEFFNRIKKYCDARDEIVHDIYEIKYDKLENKISINTSKFDLSKKNVINKNSIKEISLEDTSLINIVTKMQETRKYILKFLLNTENNINIEELKNKFKKEKGYFFIDNAIHIKL